MSPDTDPLDSILHTRPSPWRRRVRLLFWLLLVVGIGASWLYLRTGGERGTTRYLTEPATEGPLLVTVSATGNLQPTNQVEVGSELSGLVERVLVDDNDQVTQGQELARLDTARLQDQVAQGEATVAAAEATVAQMQATVVEARANLKRLRQMAELSSRADLDTAEASLKRAIANEASAHAAVTQAQAALRSQQTNLDKASIRSPIDGVVLSREVEPGQTVAASLQAPVLFTLAEDLAQMELQVDVDEADVGQVMAGQQATFTVDAWPNRHYPAVVTRVSFGSQTKDGVVSYKTLLRVANDDLSLRPGMTATAEIVTAQRERALVVPNAALRFSPPQQAAANSGSTSFVSRLLPRPPQPANRNHSRGNGGTGEPQIYVLRQGEAVAVSVTLGVSNGRVTEILAGELAAGEAVIVDAETVGK